jgi:endoglucanase
MLYRLKWRSLVLFIVLIAMVLSGAMMTHPAYAINTPWLSVSGRYIKDPNGNTVILRGVSLVDVGVADTRTRNARQLIDMATDSASGWYARVVRLPVYPDAIDKTPGWIAGPDAYFNNHLNPAVQECVARQIYCIVDWHYISDYNSSAVDTATRNFWSYVAPKFANTPNVIFELYNEPIGPNNWSTWKTTAQPWVNIIRTAAPNNIILIGSPNWSQTTAAAATSPFSGSNLAYVVHVYPQHGGQSTWDSWFGNTSTTVPYFITEWGWQNGGANPTSGTLSGYGTPFGNYLDSKGVSWTAWVFDDFWQPVMWDTSWNLLSGENYMGQFTKDFLSRHQNDNLPGPGGSTNTPTRTPTRTNTPPITNTPTRTPTTTACPAVTGSVHVGSASGAGLAGVQLTAVLSGATTITGTTDSSGSFVLGGCGRSGMVVTPVLNGYSFSPAQQTWTSGPLTFVATSTGITNTPTRTPTGVTRTPTLTPTRTPTQGLTCSPVTATITAPFTQDGAGSLCWQSSNLGSYINSWNLANLTVNGVNLTNQYVSAANLPAKINGFWYVSYTSTVAWGHFEAK